MKLVIAAWSIPDEDAEKLARVIDWTDKLNISPAYDKIEFIGVAIKDDDRRP